MMFKATFKNISAILLAVSFMGWGNQSSWRTPPTWYKSLTISHNVVSSTPRHKQDSNSQLAIDTDCIGSCKSNYYMITSRMAQLYFNFPYYNCINLWTSGLGTQTLKSMFVPKAMEPIHPETNVCTPGHGTFRPWDQALHSRSWNT